MEAIERLPESIDELTAAVEANGGHVYLAGDAAAANEYAAAIRAEHDADRLVNSESMITEGIGVNEALEDRGVEVVETDLGEWVLRVAEGTPSHIVEPALYRSCEEIAALFNERFDPEEPLKAAAEFTAFARQRPGERIAGAESG